MNIVGSGLDEQGEAEDPIRISVLRSVDRLPQIEAQALATGTFAVVVLDHLHIEDLNMHLVYEGFRSKEMAQLFARATVRDGMEELRERHQGQQDDLYNRWVREGYDAFVVPGTYRARQEVPYFVRHPANEEERDWRGMLRSTRFE